MLGVTFHKEVDRITKLEAVNSLLASINAYPVPDLAITGLPPEAVAAINILELETVKLLARGWTFNHEKVTLNPDSKGQVHIPNDILTIVFIDKPQYQKRNSKVYDSTQNTFIIDSPVEIDTFIKLDFEDCPIPAQTLIFMRAARQLQAITYGVESRNVYTENDIVDAEVRMNVFDLRQGQYNILDGLENLRE